MVEMRLIKKAPIDGEVIEYDECHFTDKKPYVELKEQGILLGEGVIYSIDGIKQSGLDNYLFYKRK